MPKRLLLPAVALLLTAPVLGAPTLLVFDPAASKLSFTLDTTFHLVHGTLDLTGGELVYDLDTGKAEGEIVVNAKGADTGNRKRDAKMHDKVLETGLFPEFVFRAERVEGSIDERGTGEVELIGTLDIHGESHPFTLPATITIVGDRLEARSGFRIPYVAWGMEDPSLLFIRAEKVVDVVVEARGRIERQGSSVSEP